MEATYISTNSFSITGQKTEEFLPNRRLRLDCGVDGIKYASIISAVFTSVTIVVIDENILTSNLTDVLYSVVKTGTQGNLADHFHSSTEGDGGYIAPPTFEFTGLTDTPTTYSGTEGLYAQSTGSGIIWTEVTTSGGEGGSSDVQTFLDLTDTPTSYPADGDYISILVDGSNLTEPISNYPLTLKLSDSAGTNSKDLTAFFNELTVSPDDAFIGEDGDLPNSDLWNLEYLQDNAIIQDNRLRVSSSYNTPIPSMYQISGDFDIQIDLIMIVLPSTAAWTMGFYVEWEGSTTDLVRMSRRYDVAVNQCYQADRRISGTWTSISDVATSDTNLSLRITRSGTTFTCYYWNGSWVSMGTYNGVADDVRVVLDHGPWSTPPAITGDFDNFKINSGTVVWPNGYPTNKRFSIQDTNGNQCYTAVEKWDIDNKEVVLHTKVPLISTNTTEYRLFYDASMEDNIIYVSDSHEHLDKGFTGETFTYPDGHIMDKHSWYTNYDLFATDDLSNVLTNIQDNKLQIDITVAATSRGNLITKGKLSGDFDIQIDWEMVGSEELAMYLWKDLTSLDDRCYIGINPANEDIRTRSKIGTTWDTEVNVSRTNDFGRFRVQRVGSAMTWQYQDGEQSWQTLGTSTWISDDCHIVLYGKCTNITLTTLIFDNLILNSGSLIEPGAYTRVWDDHFTAVYDLNQVPVVDQATILDATTNFQHAIARGTLNSSNLVDSFLTTGIQFDIDDDSIHIPDGVFSNLSHTTEIFAKFETGFADGNILCKGGSGESVPTNIYRWNWKTYGLGYYYEYDNGTNSTEHVTTLPINPRDLEYHTFSTIQGTDCYKAGIDNYVSQWATGVGNTDSTAGTALGPCYNDNNGVRTYSNWHGVVELVRISDIIRSDSWVKATNLAIRDEFVSFEFGTVSKYLAPSSTANKLEFKDFSVLKDTNFTDLLDTPESYINNEGKLLQTTTSGIEFVPRNKILSQISTVTSTGTLTPGDYYTFRIDDTSYNYYISSQDNFLSMRDNVWVINTLSDLKVMTETHPGVEFKITDAYITGDTYNYMVNKIWLTGDYSVTVYGEVINTNYNGSGLEIKIDDSSQAIQGYMKAGYDYGDKFISNIGGLSTAARSDDSFAIRMIRTGTSLTSHYSDGQTGAYTLLRTGTVDTGVHSVTLGLWCSGSISSDQIVRVDEVIIDYAGGYELNEAFSMPTISGMMSELSSDVTYYNSLSTFNDSISLTISGASTFDVTNLEATNNFNLNTKYQYLGSIENFPDIPNDPEPCEVLRRNEQGTAYEWADVILPEGRQQIIFDSQAYGDYSLQINNDVFNNRGLSIDPLYSFSVRNGLFLEDRDRLTIINGGTGTELITGQVNSFAKKWDNTGSSYTQINGMKADIFASNASLSFWYYVDFVANWLPFIGKSDASNSEWRCWLGNDENFDLFGSVPAVWDLTSLSLSTNWHHFVITYNGINAELFVDDTSQGTRAFTAGSSTDKIFYINRDGSGANYADGAVESIKIFEDILTAADITKLYNEIPVSNYMSLISSDINTHIKYTAEIADGKIYARTMYPIDVSVTTGAGLNYEMPLREISIESLTNTSSPEPGQFVRKDYTGTAYEWVSGQIADGRQQTVFSLPDTISGTEISIELDGTTFSGTFGKLPDIDPIQEFLFEGVGTEDTSAYSNNLTLSSASITTGKFSSSNAISFTTNGEANASIDLSGDQSHSVSAFLYIPSTLPDTRDGVMMLGPQTTGGLHWLLQASGSLQIGRYNGESVSVDVSSYTGQWVHIVSVYDKDAETLTSYLNGNFVSSVNMSSFSLNGSTILGEGVQAEPSFGGKIDQFRVYNFPLSTNQIAILAHEHTDYNTDYKILSHLATQIQAHADYTAEVVDDKLYVKGVQSNTYTVDTTKINYEIIPREISLEIMTGTEAPGPNQILHRNSTNTGYEWKDIPDVQVPVIKELFDSFDTDIWELVGDASYDATNDLVILVPNAYSSAGQLLYKPGITADNFTIVTNCEASGGTADTHRIFIFSEVGTGSIMDPQYGIVLEMDSYNRELQIFYRGGPIVATVDLPTQLQEKFVLTLDVQDNILTGTLQSENYYYRVEADISDFDRNYTGCWFSANTGGAKSLRTVTSISIYENKGLTELISNLPESILDFDDTPDGFSDGQYLQSTASGTVWATVSGGSGGSSDVETFLDLTDTPATYLGTEDMYLKSTGSEAVWATVSGSSDVNLEDYVPWNFGSGTISGTGDIYCNDIYTASGTVYIGDLKLSTDGENLLVNGEEITSSGSGGSSDVQSFLDLNDTPTEYPLGGKYIGLTISNSKVDASLTDFPIMLNISEDSGIGSEDLSSFFTELEAQDVDDNFTGEDGDSPSTDLWQVVAAPAATSGEIDDNKLKITIPDSANDETWRMSSKFYVSGDFDIQVDYEETSDTPSSSQSYPAEMRLEFMNSDHTYLRTRRNSDTSNAMHVSGTNTTSTSVSDYVASGKFRVTRVGTVIKWYYWDSSQWEWSGSTVGFTTGETTLTDTRVSLAGHADFDAGTVTEFDNFKVNSGTIIWPEGTHPNRKKIQIKDAVGTQCYTEIETWDHFNKKVVLHVKAPFISSVVDTQLNLMYDSTMENNTSFVGDTTDSGVVSNVWDDNFKAVYHMAQDPSDGTDAILDSTVNSTHASPVNMDSSNLVDTDFGKALSFDGSAEYIDLGTDKLVDIHADTYTIEAFVNISGTDNNTHYTIFGSYDTGTGVIFRCSRDAEGDGYVSNTADYTSTSASERGYAEIDGVNYYSMTGRPTDYITNTKNGVVLPGDIQHIAGIGSATSDATVNKEIGRIPHAGGIQYFKGTINSLRVSEVIRSATWLKASSLSMQDQLITYQFNYPSKYLSVNSTADALVFKDFDLVTNSTLLSLDDTPTTYSGTEGLYAKSTGDGIVFAETISSWNFGDNTISGTGDIYCNDLFTASGTVYIGDLKLSSDGENLLIGDSQEIVSTGVSNAQTLLDLDDTSVTYSGTENQYLKSTGSGTAWDYVSEINTGDIDPTYDSLGTLNSLYVSSESNSIFEKNREAVIEELPYTAKSIIIDVLDNYGEENLNIRSVEFYNGDSLLTFGYDDYTSDATSSHGALPDSQRHMFNTSLSKTGTRNNTSWLTPYGVVTNQRAIVVFDTAITFTKIVINNGHNGGGMTTGAKNTKIYTSSNEITSTVFNEVVPNSLLIFDGIFTEHVAEDTIDDELLSLIPNVAVENSGWDIVLETKNNLIELNDTPTTYSGTEDMYLQSTGSGTVWSTIVEEGTSNVQSFLDLDDTPTTYTEGQVLVSTVSGIEFAGNSETKTFVKAGPSTNQLITDDVTLALDSVFDGNTALVSGTNIIIPEDGRYNIKYQIMYTDSEPDNATLQEVYVETRVNTSVINKYRNAAGHSTGWNGMGIYGEVPSLELDAGDLVDFTVGQWTQVERVLVSNSAKTWVHIEKTHDPIVNVINNSAFTSLVDTPSSYTEGQYLRTTASGINAIDGIILKAPDDSEWLLGVTNSGTLTVTEV